MVFQASCTRVVGAMLSVEQMNISEKVEDARSN